MSRIDLLRQTTLFAGLPDESCRRWPTIWASASSPRAWCCITRAPGQRLYLIETGQVRIFVLSDTGHEITFNIHGPGECFGELARSTAARTRPAQWLWRRWLPTRWIEKTSST